ncbi:plasmid pRiA4b ORF-3 family protein [Amycolatopsis sp. NPDC059021]|uniref:plasmid pRiA4b ORF-3 family protein n=1 Tax=Amycolatopsis sp. NPDC059021 TaxID=3346704 RepID=UPI00366B18A1
MSPRSRGRKPKKQKKNTKAQRFPLTVVPPAGECDCPECTGEDFDPESLIKGMAAVGEDIRAEEDPLHAEVTGALVVANSQFGGGTVELFLDGLLPAIEAEASPGALALLLAAGSVGDGSLGAAASAAAARLVGAGVPEPRWAAELAEPVTVSGCKRLGDTLGLAAVLLGIFQRGDRSHGLVIHVDNADCGAARDILVLESQDVPGMVDSMREDCGAAGLEFVEEDLEPAEFRRQVEIALDAREVHDGDPLAQLMLAEALEEDEGPAYPANAMLTRARLRGLPESDKPKPPHPADCGDSASYLTSRPPLDLGRVGTAELPPKRKKSDPPAPVYQLKVSLKGAKPPIWRRLEVRADTTLSVLHEILQVAFEWEHSHPHVFQTPYGDFGIPNPELDFRDESAVTLEQAAPGAKSKFRYLYDFGDHWEHEILVEKVLDADPAADYPRCTGGKRAAPPEDCGGIGGYEHLAATLADPDDPDHESQLDWMGLCDGDEFEPEHFSAGEVNEELGEFGLVTRS